MHALASGNRKTGNGKTHLLHLLKNSFQPRMKVFHSNVWKSRDSPGPEWVAQLLTNLYNACDGYATNNIWYCHVRTTSVFSCVFCTVQQISVTKWYTDFGGGNRQSLPWKSLEHRLVGSHQKAQDWVQHPGDDGGKSTGLISWFCQQT